MNKKIAIVLAGCGVFDGAEIHEATLTMLAVVKQGFEYDVFAPDIDQHHVINHTTGQEMNEKRNVLVESARIARGKIKNLKEYNASEYCALIFPGGFGVAKNLCSFAFDGINCKVNPDAKKAILNTFNAKKPIGALCISPVLIAKVLNNLEVTIGQDRGTAEAISNLGSKHVTTNHGEIVIDTKNKIVTTPCYMLDANILQISQGAENVVKAIIGLL